MDGSILTQGTFTQPATAVKQTIVIPSNVDFLNVWNFTQAGATNGNGYHFYWQRGMPSGRGIVDIVGGASAVTAAQTAAGAFTLYDPSATPNLGAINNGSTGVTGFTAANPAVVTVGSTAGMSAGNIVRFNTLNNQSQYEGIDFSVGYGTLTGTTFSVDYLNSTGSTPSTSGNFYVIPYMPLFYPRRRVITQIIAGNPTVITLSVDHGFTVGQDVRLSFPGGTALWGNFALGDPQNNLGAVVAPLFTIVAVDTATGVGHNRISLNWDTTGYVFPFAGTTTAVNAIPTSASYPFTPAQVIPVGEDTATALSQVPPLSELADATVNTGFLGMTLAAGALLPAGSANDVVFWQAGKSVLGGL